VLVPRGEGDADEVRSVAGRALPAARIEVLDTVRIDVSSTEIRRRRAAGEPIRYLVPDAVLRVIEREGLYEDDSQC
jgi:nicotinate-nucleotide adenylyltransferase